MSSDKTYDSFPPEPDEGAQRGPAPRQATGSRSALPGQPRPVPRGVSGANPLPPGRSAHPSNGQGVPGHVARPPASRPPGKKGYFPEQLHTLADSGLTTTMVEELILKAVFFAGEMRGMDIAEKIKLPTHIVDDAIEALRKQKYLDLKGGGGVGLGRSTQVFQVTSFANDILHQILDRNRYNGPAPVPFAEWAKAVKAQSVRGNRITRAKMADKFGDLIISDYIFDGIGPAMNSGRAIFFYGPPGNGKTAICQCMVDCFEGEIFIPHALLVDDFIIRLYDPTIHRELEPDPAAPHDNRWVRIRRPLVVVGGELTLDMLDLTYSSEVKYYEASFQMKASNGMLLVDDFGRQRVAPIDLLNRWIVPLESDIDFLTMHTGKKLQTPFDVFVAFSTNLDPSSLVDDAFLRRVRYKLEVQRPDLAQFHAIWKMICTKRNVPYDAELVQYLIDEHYTPSQRPFAACQPRDLIDQMIDMANYRGFAHQLHPDLFDAAVKSYFVKFDKRVTDEKGDLK
jgi:hypothetical protein